MNAKISGLAILSFICGIIGGVLLLCHIYLSFAPLIFSLALLLLSLIFGALAIIIISLSKEKLKGKLLAIIGIIIGLFFILFALSGMVV